MFYINYKATVLRLAERQDASKSSPNAAKFIGGVLQVVGSVGCKFATHRRLTLISVLAYLSQLSFT